MCAPLHMQTSPCPLYSTPTLTWWCSHRVGVCVCVCDEESSGRTRKQTTVKKIHNRPTDISHVPAGLEFCLVGARLDWTGLDSI